MANNNYTFPQKLQDRGGEVYNVDAFGARYDGTDQTSVFEEILDVMPATGGTILVPGNGKTLSVQGPIDLTKPNITLINRATIKKIGTASHLIEDRAAVADGFRYHGDGGKIDMNRSIYTAPVACSAFHFIRNRDLRFYDLWVENFIEDGLKLYSVQNVYVVRPRMINGYDCGIQVHNLNNVGLGYTGSRDAQDIEDIWVTDGYFEAIDDTQLGAGNGVGVFFSTLETTKTVRRVYALNNTCKSCVRAIWAEASTQTMFDFHWRGNISELCTQQGIGLVGVAGFNLSDNIVRDTGSTAVRDSPYNEIAGIMVSGDATVQSRDGVLERNVITDTRATPIMDYGVLVYGHSSNPTTRIKVRNNPVVGATILPVWIKEVTGLTASTIVPDPAPICRVRRTAGQTLTTATLTALAFDAEDYDTDSMHDNSTNNSRITIQHAGKYRITGGISYTSNSTGIRMTRLLLNSASILSEGIFNAVATDDTSYSMNGEAELIAGDYLELMAWQNSGGDLAVRGGSGVPTFLAAEFVEGK